MQNSHSKRFGFWLYFPLLFCVACMAFGADWPQWGGTPSRNMVATGAVKLPCWFSPGVTDDKDEIKPESTANVRWGISMRGGYSSPVVGQGRIIAGELNCFDFVSGKLLWSGGVGGAQATATIEGDRVYAVTSKGTVVCLDLYSEKKGGRGVVIWSYDMVKELGVCERSWGCSSSPLIIGDYLYVGTSNGRGMSKTQGYHPLTPTLIALNKHTGQLVARDDEQIGVRNYGSQHSSPSSGMVNGKIQIYYNGGDGVCYAFEPVDPAAKIDPDKFITTKLRRQLAFIPTKSTREDVNAAIEEMKKIEQNTGIPAGDVRCCKFAPMSIDDMSVRVPDVPCLKKIWSCDCTPKEYKEDANGLPISLLGGSAATPVFYNNKVYVPIGESSNVGMGPGNIVCIDATRKGDMKAGEWLWNYKMNNTLSTVAVADGLVYTVDLGAIVCCLDVETGKKYWEYHCVPESEMKSGWGHSGGAGHCYASPIIADGKLYITTLKRLFVFATGKEAKLLGKIDISNKADGYSTPCAVGNTLLVCYGKKLWAAEDKGAVAPATEEKK